jgi:hypothetical protein
MLLRWLALGSSVHGVARVADMSTISAMGCLRYMFAIESNALRQNTRSRYNGSRGYHRYLRRTAYILAELPVKDFCSAGGSRHDAFISLQTELSQVAVDRKPCRTKTNLKNVHSWQASGAAKLQTAAFSHFKGAILADEMGLGKTLTAYRDWRVTQEAGCIQPGRCTKVVCNAMGRGIEKG